MKKIATVFALMALVALSRRSPCDKTKNTATQAAVSDPREGPRKSPSPGYLTDSNCERRNANAKGKIARPAASRGVPRSSCTPTRSFTPEKLASVVGDSTCVTSTLRFVVERVARPWRLPSRSKRFEPIEDLVGAHAHDGVVLGERARGAQADAPGLERLLDVEGGAHREVGRAVPAVGREGVDRPRGVERDAVVTVSTAS